MHFVARGRLVVLLIAALVCVPWSPARAHASAGAPQVMDPRPGIIAPMERDLLAEFPWDAGSRRRSAVAKVAAPVVGTPRTFWAHNSRTGRFYLVQATCQVVGVHCYIFVEDTQWGGRVHQDDVDAISRAFDAATPGHPDRGIHQIETEAFGPPPDVDDDPRVYLLILDIQDTFNGSGTYIAGYLSGTNEFTDQEARRRGFRSNEVEMFYLDCNPLDIRSSVAHNVVAHEFQHMIHFGTDPQEETWLNEGCSVFSELLTGYGARQPYDFSRLSDDGLVEWGSGLLDYEQTGMFVTYLHERYGGLGTIRALIAGTTSGTESVDNTLRPLGTDFGGVFKGWVIANYMDDSGPLGEQYGYDSYALSGDYQFLDGAVHAQHPVTVTESSVNYSAARYIRFEHVRDISIHFAGSERNTFVLQYIGLAQGLPVEVGEIPLDERNEGLRDFRGDALDAVVLVPTVLERTFLRVSFSYSTCDLPAGPNVGGIHPGIAQASPLPGAEGVSLLKALRLTFNRPYDPGTLVLDTGDYPGGEIARSQDGQSLTVTPADRLEPEKTYTVTVRAGVRDTQGAPMVDTDFVWRFTTASADQPLELAYDTGEYGEQLCGEEEGQGSGVWFTPPYAPALLSAAYFYMLCVDYGGSFMVRVLPDRGDGTPDFSADLLDPPVLVAPEQTGWFHLDLTPYGIRVDGDFHIMAEHVDSSWPSFGADTVPPISGRSWDLAEGASVHPALDADYAIRAAIAPPPTLVEDETQAPALPDRFALQQNAPNPFNSQTVIRYAIPWPGVVSLEVYDALGQRVRTLRDGVHLSGFHTVSWDGRDQAGADVASGLYLCRLGTPEGQITRRMVLLR